MIVDYAHKKISEDEKFVTYQYNTPVYDDKGYFTRTWDDSNPDIVTIVKWPQFNEAK